MKKIMIAASIAIALTLGFASQASAWDFCWIMPIPCDVIDG